MDVMLPEWPDIAQYSVPGGMINGPKNGERGVALIRWGYSHLQEEVTYERARAAAWETRCRYLLELMAHIENCADIDEWPHQEVKQAVAFIGPLPPLPQTNEGGG